MTKLHETAATRLTWRLTLRASCGLLFLCGIFVLSCLVTLNAMRGFAGGFSDMTLVRACLYFGTGAAGLFVAWRAGSALWAPLPLPRGLQLGQKRLPLLYAFVDGMGRRCDGIEVDAVWLTDDFNAAVLQRPRWGLFGRFETHLMVGLPLACRLSKRELAAILAHEYGHIRRFRCTRAAWSVHVRSWWLRALDRWIETMPLCAPLFDRWTFSELSDALRLARYEEFEADRSAAGVVGAQTMVDTLHAVEAAFKTSLYAEGCAHADTAEVMGGVAVHPSLAERCAALGCHPSDGGVEQRFFRAAQHD